MFDVSEFIRRYCGGFAEEGREREGVQDVVCSMPRTPVFSVWKTGYLGYLVRENVGI